MAKHYFEQLEAPLIVALDINAMKLSDEQFFQLCQDNENLRLELTAQGELILICPDFVLELRSKSDSLKYLQAKMREYISNGAQPDWLIDPIARRVYVYRPNRETEILDNPRTNAGDPALPGCILDLKDIW
ncbi:MAG TPA: Uma2 family endonuclease [Blastocatellia bacterium]|jgi:Uma2 family endonuclease|nr:Uma2 family endonuclease [Blastocatellia bacterium]